MADNTGEYGPQDDYGYDPYADQTSSFQDNTSYYDGGQSQMNTSNYNPYQTNDFTSYANPAYDFSQYNSGSNGSGGQMSMINQDQYDPYAGMDQGQAAQNMQAPAAAPDSGTQSFLQRLFSRTQGGQGNSLGSDLVKGGVGLLGSLMQSRNNTANTALGNKVMQQMDPFGAQRAGYQQKLADTYTNPMGTLQRPEIAGQLAQMKQVMDANDAKAGRRSQYGSRMNQLAEQQAKLMDSYRAQLGQFAGSQFGPNTSAGASILQGVNSANSNPLAPFTTAMGNIINGDDITQRKQSELTKQSDLLAQIQALVKKG